jgi:hypothetical protein
LAQRSLVATSKFGTRVFTGVEIVHQAGRPGAAQIVNEFEAVSWVVNNFPKSLLAPPSPV